MKPCPFCGAEHPDDARVCTACGSVLDKTSAETPDAVPGDDNGDGIPDLQYDSESADWEHSEGEDTPQENGGETPSGHGTGAPYLTEAEFYEKTVPDRVKQTLRSLVTYLWLCAVLNLLIGAAMWQDLTMMLPSLLISASDAVLAVFIRKRKRWAAVTGIVYSSVGGVLFTVLGLLRGEGIGATRVLIGWLCSLGLFIGVLYAIREVNTAWKTYSETGRDPWDTATRGRRRIWLQRHDRVNRFVIAAVAVALAVVLMTVFLVLAAGKGRPTPGVWDGAQYTNEYFGFSYTLPEGWTRMSDDALSESNRIYYGGTDLGRYGGGLLEAYDRESYEAASAMVAVSAVRQDSDRYTDREILEDWLADTAESTGTEGVGYSCGEIGTQVLAGETFLSVKETFLYPANDGTGALLPEIRYTLVRQVGYYTLTVEVLLWEPFPDEPEDLFVQKLLAAFLAYAPAETPE